MKKITWNTKNNLIKRNNDISNTKSLKKNKWYKEYSFYKFISAFWLQVKIIKRQKLFSLIMIFCIFFVIFFTSIIASIPTALNQINTMVNSFKPYYASYSFNGNADSDDYTFLNKSKNSDIYKAVPHYSLNSFHIININGYPGFPISIDIPTFISKIFSTIKFSSIQKNFLESIISQKFSNNKELFDYDYSNTLTSTTFDYKRTRTSILQPKKTDSKTNLLPNGDGYDLKLQDSNFFSVSEFINTSTYVPFFYDSKNLKNISPLYVYGVPKNYDIENIQKLLLSLISIYITLVDQLLTVGLGGFYANDQIFSEGLYLDLYSCFIANYFLKSKYSLKQKEIAQIPWLLTNVVSIILSKAILKNPSLKHSVIFKKFTSISFNSNIGYNLQYQGLFQFLIQLLTIYIPSYVANPLLNISSQLIKWASPKIKDIINIPFKHKFSSGYFVLPKELQESILFHNLAFIKTSLMFLMFQTLPYSPENKDELYTKINFYLKGALYNSSLNGYAINAKFWQKNTNAFNELKINGAFAYNPKQSNLLNDGITADHAIPVIINKSFHFKYKNNVGDIFKKVIQRKLHHTADARNNYVFEDNRYFKIVGISNNFGEPAIYTSRQETNVLVLTKYEITKHISKFNVLAKPISDLKNIYIYGMPNQENMYKKNKYDPNQSSENIWPKQDDLVVNDPIYTLNKNDKNTLNSPSLADGYGYFNAAHYITKNNPAIKTFFIRTATRNLGVTNVGNLNSPGIDVFSYTYIIKTYNSAKSLLWLIIGVLVFFTILLFFIVFIFLQRSIVTNNIRTLSLLKLMGYSRRYIAFANFSFFVLIYLFLAVIMFGIFQLVARVIVNIFRNYINVPNFYWTTIFTSTESILIYIFVLCFIFFLFLILGYRAIKKINLANTKTKIEL